MRSIVAGGVVLAATAAPVAAQTSAPAKTTTDQQRQSRFQISQMERMLEGAVEHGATLFRDHLQSILPAQYLISENARVRGFRLEGYGVFFDVEVPGVQGTLSWIVRTLDQNDRGLESAFKSLKTFIDRAGDPNVQQALKRIEAQVGPTMAVASTAPAPAGARTATGAPSAVAANGPSGGLAGSGGQGNVGNSAGYDQQGTPDPILNDPDEAFRSEIKQQIMDAMLAYSVPLEIGDDEWLTVAARGHDERPLIAPADSNGRTEIIRIRGGDLASFRAGKLSKADALGRMEVRVF
jgi:hypothetical protein